MTASATTVSARRDRAVGRRNQGRGFSLVEVLVAIVVLSFGLLGMVGMQAFALQSNREARQQGQAAVFARELAEMMRGNMRVSTDPDAANNPYLKSFSVGSLNMGSNASYCLSATASAACTNTLEVAKSQMTDWLSRVDAELPGAQVTICLDAAPYDASGLPQWNCTLTGSDQIMVIKIGWTRSSTDRRKTGTDALERVADFPPNIIFPVTSGNSISGT
jgi:type IV pilus assembly protein PilV